MDCYRVRRFLAGHCDNSLSSDQRQAVRSHLARCRSCASLSQQYVRERAALRALPVLTPPEQLLTSLRILASRERARRQFGVGLAGWLARWAVPVKIRTEALMRPLALPVAGGLLSAVVLFALVVPNFFAPHRVSHSVDVPTILSSEPIFVGLGPFGFSLEEPIAVDVRLDSQGRFMEFSLPGGPAWTRDPEVRRSIGNALLFARFSPGTTFGQPASSQIRIILRRSYIDVRG